MVHLVLHCQPCKNNSQKIDVGGDLSNGTSAGEGVKADCHLNAVISSRPQYDILMESRREKREMMDILKGK